VREWVERNGARWRPDPVWKLLPTALQDLASQPLGPVLSVHPLGGCGIGHDALDGVVDVDGRVFQLPTPCHGDERWEGSLRVLDGAMLPGSLGVNPALTIAALSHAACQQFAAECGWTPRMGPPKPPLPRQPLPWQRARRRGRRASIWSSAWWGRWRWRTGRASARWCSN
jgi:cholesterol oxidase